MRTTIKFLGTGTSTGVPEINCGCEVCRSVNPKDKRLRTSALVTVGGKRLLIDCGPDFREQMLRYPVDHIDAVLITHSHYDHGGGLDDLRPFSREPTLPIYAEQGVIDDLRTRMPYCFLKVNYPGLPHLSLEPITTQPFTLEGVRIEPIRVMHYKLPILGYRIGRMAYLTDLLTLPAHELERLQGLDLLVVTALRIEPHISHQNLAAALQLVQQIAPQEAYFIHMSHQIGLHDEVSQTLPSNVHFAYDGLELTVE